MGIDVYAGLMKNVESDYYGNPYEILENIKKGKEKNLDILVGPEWGLNSVPGVYSKSILKKQRANIALDAMFNAPDYCEYAPRDAKKILEKQVEETGLKYFDKLPMIPYSEREYNKLVDSLKSHSKNSDMIIFPGTAMFYDQDKRLYNAMPVLKNGEVIKTLYKFRDGLGSKFNLNNTLFLYPIETQGLSGLAGLELAYGRDPRIYMDNLKIGVEICADTDVLKKDYNINDLDIHILSSCGNTSTSSAIHKNGYLLVVDGYLNPEVKVADVSSRKISPSSNESDLATFELKF